MIYLSYVNPWSYCTSRIVRESDVSRRLPAVSRQRFTFVVPSVGFGPVTNSKMYLKVLLLVLLCVGFSYPRFVNKRARRSPNPCKGVIGQKFISHPSNCRKYMLCVYETLHQLSCGNMIWDESVGKCVDKSMIKGPNPCKNRKYTFLGHHYYCPLFMQFNLSSVQRLARYRFHLTVAR